MFNIQLNRPKATATTITSVTLGISNPTASANKWTQFLTLNGVDAPSFAVTCSVLENSAVVQLPSNLKPGTIRPGDIVTGVELDDQVEVAVLSVSGTTCTLSSNCLADNADAIFTFNPPVVSAKLVGIVGEVNLVGTTVRVKLLLYRSSGLTVQGAVDETTISQMDTALGETTISVDLDTFLSNIRIPRGN